MYETLKGFDDYEICKDYPYDIRKKGKTTPLQGTISNNGYRRILIHRKMYMFHRLVANQFIPNDDPLNKTEIDHVNHDRADNHIENLRWVSKRENNINRTSYYRGRIAEYVDELPEDAFEFNEYNGHELEDYYYSSEEDTFYFFNGVQYRKLPLCSQNGRYFVNARDIDGAQIRIHLSTFKKLYDIN